MKKQIALLTSILLLISIGVALDAEDFEDLDYNETQIEIIQEQINENQEDIPGFIGSVIRDDKVNFYVEDELLLSVEFDGTKIQEIHLDEIEQPNVDVYVEDKQVIGEILDAESPIEEVRTQLNEEGGLTYETRDYGTSAKFFIVERAMSIASLFNIF